MPYVSSKLTMPCQLGYRFAATAAKSPLKLPNPNVCNPFIDQSNFFPPEINKKMTNEIRDAICSASSLQAGVNKCCDTGRYMVSSNKQRRLPYDDFLRFLTINYGVDTRFPDGPVVFTASLFLMLRPCEEYIFALVMAGMFLQLMVLPRKEMLLIDENLYHGRHTHQEFLMRDYAGSLMGAGTMFVDRSHRAVRYSLRTGHFQCHRDAPAEQHKISDVVGDVFRRELVQSRQSPFCGASLFRRELSPINTCEQDGPVRQWVVSF